MNYNENLIRVFGKILITISSNVDNQNLDLLIIKAGQYYSQYELEYSAEKINAQVLYDSLDLRARGKIFEVTSKRMFKLK